MVGASSLFHRQVRADTDNWMWPRHGRLLLIPHLRRQGRPTLRLQPRQCALAGKEAPHHQLAGYREGDFTFVMGFPGRNWRYMISDEVEERMQTTNFMRHHVRDVRQKALMEQMLKDDAVRIHYAKAIRLIR